MTLVVKDRIKETSSTTGTGTLTLGGAIAGFRTFADVGDGNTTYYCIKDGNNFEVGIGTYTHSGTTLSRDTVLQTSAGNTTKINCTGSQEVFVTQPADKAVFEDASGKVGLGTPNPSQNLHISSSDHTRALITGGTNKYAELQFENDAQKFAMGVQDDDKFFLYNSTGTSTVLTVDTSSNITFGSSVTSPGYTANSSGSGTVDGLIITNSSTTNNGLTVGVDSSENAFIWNGSNTELRFATNNEQKMEIDSSGRVTVSEVGTDTTLSGGQPGFQVTGSGFDGYMAAVRRDSSAYSSGIILAKSRNTTADNFTIVQDNDTLGSILFIGDDGTDLDTYGAYITAEVNGTPAANNMPTDLVFATNAGAATATERMKIGKSGEIQIGGASSAGFIDFDGTNLQLNTQRNPNTGTFVNTSRSHAAINLKGSDGGSSIEMRTHGANNANATAIALTIDSSQNVLVGRSALGISNTGHTLAAAGYVEFTRDGAAALNVGRNSSVGDTAVFWKNGSEAGAIGSAGGSANEIYFAARAGKALLINNNGLLAGTQSGGGSDNTTDLGQSDVRWKDLHLSNIGYAGASFRAPIFYDSGNTTYYCDPASSSNLYQVRSNGGITAGTISGLNSMGQIGLYATAPYISFHSGTLDRTAYIQESGGAFYLYEATFTAMSGSARSPLFYDLDNTSYYTDPAGNSQLYRLVATDRIQGQTYIEALSYLSSPIMYDYNSTGYYCDPSSTSNLNYVSVQTDLYLGRALNVNIGGGGASGGTSGQVLTSQGTNAAPQWQDAGGGAWEVIGNYTGTNVNSVDFINGTNGFVWNNSTYKKITMYGNMVGTNSDNMMIQCFPLVSSGSSGNVVPNTLVFYVLEWIESFPEFSVSLSSSQKYYYQSSNNNNNNGVMWYMQAGATPSSNGGVGSFGQTIGGTYFGSNKRRLDTTIIFEVDALGLGTNKTFSWRARTNQDYPSFYFYPRQFDGETLSYGWTNQGLRIKSTSTSQNFNYDFTFIGLKP